MSEVEQKEWIDVSTMGHVEHGKSTLIGHLLYKVGAVPAREMQEAERDARSSNREDLKYAFLLTRTQEERKRGRSKYLYHYSIPGDRRNIMIIDCPGQWEFARNMIIGASEADAGILVVAADDFETGLGSYRYDARKKRYIVGQTREHSFISHALGINRLIVAVNKMDKADWLKEKYSAARDRLLPFLTEEVGFKPESLTFVPVSAYTGENLVEPSTRMSWYAGPTFLQALNALETPPRKPELPLRMPIERIYFSVRGVQVVLCGRPETGVLDVGDEIVVEPEHVTGQVRSIHMRDERTSRGQSVWVERKKVSPGNVVGLGITNVSGIERLVSHGVLGHARDGPLVARKFTASVYVYWHPDIIRREYTPEICVGPNRGRCKFSELVERTEISSGLKEPNPSSLKAGDVATVHMALQDPMVLEKFENFPALGRFVIRDNRLTVGAGTITQIASEEESP